MAGEAVDRGRLMVRVQMGMALSCIVVAVVVDSPHFDYRTGGAAAAPVFAAVMEQALHRLGVTPDGEQR